MTDKKEILDCLQLISTENIGPKTFLQLVARFGSAAAALDNLPPRYHPYNRARAEDDLRQAEKLGISVITDTSPEYPTALLNIDDRPPVLYVRGDMTMLKQNNTRLAVVGSRNASINGRKLASKLSCDLTTQGITIVSGMARGIDTAAHKGALYACGQTGKTITVLGTGADIPYPAENKDLYEQILEQGCVISELPPGTTPQASNFPRRNRIISGLCSGVLVIEANIHSGSLITAYTAAEQGREVMAVPGSPLDGRSQGANKLIKDGAYLVENIEDILSVLQNIRPLRTFKAPTPAQRELFTPPLDNTAKSDNIPPQTSVMDFLTTDGVYVDEIIAASSLDSATVATELLELELEGKISRLPGGKVALIK